MQVTLSSEKLLALAQQALSSKAGLKLTTVSDDFAKKLRARFYNLRTTMRKHDPDCVLSKIEYKLEGKVLILSPLEEIELEISELTSGEENSTLLEQQRYILAKANWPTFMVEEKLKDWTARNISLSKAKLELQHWRNEIKSLKQITVNKLKVRVRIHADGDLMVNLSDAETYILAKDNPYVNDGTHVTLQEVYNSLVHAHDPEAKELILQILAQADNFAPFARRQVKFKD